MNKGVLLFAFQGDIDYISLAIFCAKRVKKYLNLPISIVTDSKENLEKLKHSGLFDKILESSDDTSQKKLFYNGSSTYHNYVWKNSNRSLSYELTPYDHTIVLDVDYIVNSDFLLKCLDIDKDFLIFKDSCDLSFWRNSKEFKYISDYSIDFYWATVLIFKKTNKNKIFFNLVNYIKDNWNYYRSLYQISDSKFRNDFAFSIAIHIFSGFISKSFENIIPSKIYYTLDRDYLYKVDDNSCTFLVEKENLGGQYVPVRINNVDVHVMNKFSLIENIQ
jgi:hypothetical protein